MDDETVIVILEFHVMAENSVAAISEVWQRYIQDCDGSLMPVSVTAEAGKEYKRRQNG